MTCASTRNTVAAIGALLFSGTPLQAAELPSQISEPSAARLAAEGVQHGFTARDFIYDGDQQSSPFFTYSVLLPPPASWGFFGYFAVNRWTADVWALWGCNRLSTPALRKSQAAIRRRFTHAELKQYAKVHDLEPDCVYRDTPETRGSPARGLAGVIRDIRTSIERKRAAE